MSTSSRTASSSTVPFVRAIVATIAAMNGVKTTTTPGAIHSGSVALNPVTSCNDPNAATPIAATNDPST